MFQPLFTDLRLAYLDIMTDPAARLPQLADRAALHLHRARAQRMIRDGRADAFLHHEAIDELQERLSEVKRTFTSPALVTGLPEIWGPAFPGAKLVGDDPVLDLAPGTHDLVIHAMALHWADDPVGQLIQSLRALKPDGLFLCAMIGGRSLHELRTALAEAEVEMTGGLSPRVLPMAEIRDLGALLQRAGFALPVADSLIRTVEYRSPMTLFSDLRGMGETNALAQRHRAPMRRAVLARALEVLSQNFATPEGRLRSTFEVICLSGWAPHESQQQPLRPGSAKQRLADALKIPDQPEN